MKIETYRGLVMAQEVDSNNHMNVQFYTTRFDMASGQFLAHLGYDFQEFKAKGNGFCLCRDVDQIHQGSIRR